MVRCWVVVPAGDVATDVSDITTPPQAFATRTIEQPNATAINSNRCIMPSREVLFDQLHIGSFCINLMPPSHALRFGGGPQRDAPPVHRDAAGAGGGKACGLTKHQFRALVVLVPDVQGA